jgi:hypothetical protein
LPQERRELMTSLKGSRTEKNILAAVVGESQAVSRYASGHFEALGGN